MVPAGAPIAGGTTLTLTGDGFAQSADVFVLSRLRCIFDWSSTAVESGVLPQVSSVSWRNATQLECAAPASLISRPPYLNHGATVGSGPRTVRLRIALNGASASIASLPFAYYEHPTISGLLPAAGPVGGGTAVLLQGGGLRNFESPHGRGTCRFGTTIVPMTVHNDSAAVCRSPTAPPGAGVVSLLVALNGDDFGPLPAPAATAYQYYEAPVISHVTPLGGAASGGTTVTLHGSGFRLSVALLPPLVPKCLFGNASDAGWEVNASGMGTTLRPGSETRWSAVTELSATHAVCSLPMVYGGAPQAATPLRVALAINAQDFVAASPNLTFVVFSMPQPAVGSGEPVAPSGGPVRGGTRVRIHGHSLDALFVPGVSVCFFGPSSVPVQFVDSLGAVCDSPTGAVGTIPLRLTLNGLDNISAAGWNYTYYAEPWLLTAAPRGGSVLGGTEVTLTGYGLFGGVVESALRPRCKFCHAADTDATGSRCTRGTDADGARLEGEYSANVSRAAVAAPAAGVEVLVCTTPPVANGSVALELALNGVDGSPSAIRFDFFPPPQLLALTPAAGPDVGGSMVTLYGIGFDAFGAVPLTLAWSGAGGGASATHRLMSRCRFGAVDSPVVDMSPTRAVCAAPAQVSAGPTDVHLSLNGAVEDQAGVLSFLYYHVEISALVPPAGPTGGGTRLNISGVGFASGGSSVEDSADGAAPHGRRLLCRLGGAVANATLLSSTQLACEAPPAMGGAASVAVAISLNGVDFSAGGAASRFIYYLSPSLLTVTPLGGPTAGRTLVTLQAAAPLPFLDLFSSCRLGDVITRANSALLTMRSGQAALVGVAAGAPSASRAISCLSPAHAADDVEVAVALNGQQFISRATLDYTSLPSAALEGAASAQPQLLRGARFRFYPPPTVLGLQPATGPAAGGTLVVILGDGFDGNALRGGATTARCRFGTYAAVPATVRDAQRLECIAPPAIAGRVAVQVSLNGGADWGGNRTSVSWGSVAAPAYEYACAPNASIEECLRDGRSCGWCADTRPGQCMPCAEIGVADALGVAAQGAPRCASGPQPPQTCAAWRHVTRVPALPPEGDASAHAAMMVNASVAAGETAYFRFAAPHRYSVLQLSRSHVTRVAWFVRRGAVPAADDAWRAPPSNPLKLFANTSAAAVACAATAPMSAACDTAWYLGAEGSNLYQVQVNHPTLLLADASLNPPLIDGGEQRDHAPHSGNFVIQASTSSTFGLVAAWDFDYRHFAPQHCRGGADGCGLVLVGGSRLSSVGSPSPTVSSPSAPAVSENAPLFSLLRPKAMDAGAAWHRDPLRLIDGFETSFEFRVHSPTLCPQATADGCSHPKIGGSGFSLVLQNSKDGSRARGCAGDGLGLLSEGACMGCVTPSLALRFDTHLNLTTTAAGVAQWGAHNQVRLLLSPACETRAQLTLAARSLGLADGIWLDDGSLHQVIVRYTRPHLLVQIDGRSVLTSPLSLVDAAAASAPAATSRSGSLATGVADPRTYEAPILDVEGRAFIGFAAASGAAGHEQYEIAAWRFHRNMAVPTAADTTSWP